MHSTNYIQNEATLWNSKNEEERLIIESTLEPILGICGSRLIHSKLWNTRCVRT